MKLSALTSQDISNLATFFSIFCQTSGYYLPNKCHVCEHNPDGKGCRHPLNPIEIMDRAQAKAAIIR